MASRRSIFQPEYGTSPIPKSKRRAPLPPPDTRPGVPLSMGGGGQAGPMPPPQPGMAPGMPQAAPQGAGGAMGDGEGTDNPDMTQLLQRLLAELGDRGGMNG